LAKRTRDEFSISATATLEKVVAALGDTAPHIAQKINYPSLRHWLSELHQPSTPEMGKSALMAARTLAKMQLIHAAKTAQQAAPVQKSAMDLGNNPLNGIALPFVLSHEQQDVVSNINHALNSPYPLDGLLNADVGCGKTICYAIPIVRAYRAGYQCCVLAPATLLVKQIARFIRQSFPDVCIEEIVAGQAIHNEQAILVGTVALLSAAKRKKYQPNLLVIDEQQRFSLAQRSALKGEHTNVLQVTATAVPRELALVEHAGKPVYLITTPPVAKTIHTRVVSKAQRSELFEYLRGFADRGKQQAIIYPKIMDKAGRRGLLQVSAYWEKHYPGLVVKIHGQQDEVENLAAMKRMEEKTALILIASTAIEVGIDLPDLKALTIIEPQHFGIAQLHQLRGRVARRGGTGYCLLYQGEDVSDETMSRIKLLEKHPDGFSIALADMENRGFGQFDEADDIQSGKTYSIFPQIRFTPQELREVADAISADGQCA
jgi:ATP-dependent DNA helicase RecG